LKIQTPADCNCTGISKAQFHKVINTLIEDELVFENDSGALESTAKAHPNTQKPRALNSQI
jgi:hypothetical protein